MAKKILIIEDEPDILTYLTAVLEDHGFNAYSMVDQMSLDETVKSLKPDLIMLDVMMPKRSGVSIYRELKSSPELKCIPVAIISGFSPEGDDMASGFHRMLPDGPVEAPNGFVDKPVDRQALITLARRLTSQHEDRA